MGNELSNSLLKEVVKDILEREGEKKAKEFMEQLKESFQNKNLGELGFTLEDLRE